LSRTVRSRTEAILPNQIRIRFEPGGGGGPPPDPAKLERYAKSQFPFAVAVWQY
jgi:hypothetical protein